MKKLVELDAGLANTPLSHRTPQWFADLYLRHMANSSDARNRRIVYDSDDSDIAVDIDLDFDDIAPGLLKEGRSRTLRRVRRAEILSLIARHKSWFIEDQMRSSRDTTIIDVDVWRRWQGEARRSADDMEADESDDDMPPASTNERRVAPVSNYNCVTKR